MKVATDDRGEIIHFAGYHRLSPALRDGAPAFAPPGDPQLPRCGWETFFRAMTERRLALVHDTDDPVGTIAFAPAAEAKALPRIHGRGSLKDALDHARRFVRAMFPRRAGPKPEA